MSDQDFFYNGPGVYTTGLQDLQVCIIGERPGARARAFALFGVPLTSYEAGVTTADRANDRWDKDTGRYMHGERAAYNLGSYVGPLPEPAVAELPPEPPPQPTYEQLQHEAFRKELVVAAVRGPLAAALLSMTPNSGEARVKQFGVNVVAVVDAVLEAMTPKQEKTDAAG